jgi:hypothetical protein
MKIVRYVKSTRLSTLNVQYIVNSFRKSFHLWSFRIDVSDDFTNKYKELIGLLCLSDPPHYLLKARLVSFQESPFLVIVYFRLETKLE